MSYDYQLNRADGYMEEHGYVHVGWKCVLKFGNTLMPWKPLQKIRVPSTMLRSLAHTTDYSTMHSFVDLLSVFSQMAECKFITSFPPRQLIEDTGDGFHVAATRDQALGIGPGFGATNQFGRLKKAVLPIFDDRRHYADKLAVEEITLDDCVKPPGALVRVLVPEHALRHDGSCVRCKAILVIPPDEQETAEDIAACDEWNRVHGGRAG